MRLFAPLVGEGVALVVVGVRLLVVVDVVGSVDRLIIENDVVVPLRFKPEEVKIVLRVEVVLPVVLGITGALVVILEEVDSTVVVSGGVTEDVDRMTGLGSSVVETGFVSPSTVDVGLITTCVVDLVETAPTSVDIGDTALIGAPGIGRMSSGLLPKRYSA